jgi:hypothetical protein
MIDLQLQDWWSRQRLTQLSYPNLSLSGASVSLRVILEPFKNVGAIWYSKIYGEYQDNVLLLACSPDLEGLSDRVKMPRTVSYSETLPRKFFQTFY